MLLVSSTQLCSTNDGCGQGMPKAEFEEMTKTIDGLISFISFFYRQVEIGKSPSILLITLPRTPFASVNSVSYFKDQEDEVLFSMHTVFRISEIKPMNKSNRLVQVGIDID